MVNRFIDRWYDHRTDEERRAEDAIQLEYEQRESEKKRGEVGGLAGNVEDLKFKKVEPAIVVNFMKSAQNLGSPINNWFDDKSFWMGY